MSTSKVTEWAWKVATVVLFPMVLLLGGWVWQTQETLTSLSISTNMQIVALQDENQELKSEVAEAAANGKSIVGIQKDIEYMKASLTRIENKL
jgi:hypothetical protein